MQQLLVGAGLAQPPVVQHEDAVGVLHGGEAVGDDDRGAARQEPGEGVPDQELGFGVDAGGRLVQDQDLRIVGEGAGEGEQLLLPDRQRGAPFPEPGFVPPVQAPDEGVGVDGLRGPDGVARADGAVSQPDVFHDAPGEEEDVLEHDADRAAQGRQVVGPDIDAVDEDGPPAGVVGPVEEGDEGRFARPRGADDGDPLARLHREGDVPEHRLPRVVGEAHAPELDLSPLDRARGGPFGGNDRGGGVEQLEDPLRRGHGGLQDGVFLAEVRDRPEEAVGILDEGHQRPQRERARKHLEPSVPDDQTHGQRADDLEQGEEEGVIEDGLEVGVEVVAVDGGEAPVLLPLLSEDLDDGGAGDVLLEERVDAGDGGAHPPVGIAHLDLEQEGDRHEQREDAEDAEGQPVVEQEEEDEDAGQREDVVEDRQDAGSEQLVERVHVGGHPRHQAADRVAVEKGRFQLLQVTEDLQAQVAHDLLPHQVDQHRLAEAQGEDQDDGKGVEGGDAGESADVAVLDRAVDGQLGQVRLDDGAGGPQDQAGDGREGAPAVRPEIAEEPAHQPRVVSFSQYLFLFRHGRQISESSSSSSCLR